MNLESCRSFLYSAQEDIPRPHRKMVCRRMRIGMKAENQALRFLTKESWHFLEIFESASQIHICQPMGMRNILRYIICPAQRYREDFGAIKSTVACIYGKIEPFADVASGVQKNLCVVSVAEVAVLLIFPVSVRCDIVVVEMIEESTYIAPFYSVCKPRRVHRPALVACGKEA